jgi:hypothetical protein
MLGKVISTLLKNNGSLLVLVDTNNIYPYVLNEGTQLPAIVYTIDSVVPIYDKDGWVWDECTFSVVSFSDNYASLQSISLEVRTALELEGGTTGSITTSKIYLTGQAEGYNIVEDVFLNKLTFSTNVTSYS